MSYRSVLLVGLLLVGRLPAQDLFPHSPAPTTPQFSAPAPCASGNCFAEAAVAPERGCLESTRKFSNFIGFMSNPLQNIDPRSLTQLVPIVMSSWLDTSAALPDLDAQVYGPAFSLAITDRFCVGLNQGGYAAIHIDRVDPRRPLLNQLAQNRGVEFGGTRTGFLDMGGFAQYTLIEDVEDQFLLTVGMRMTVPMGSYEVFQGRGPVQMAPYVTVGKEICNFHFLATAGYQFPLESGNEGLSLFYLNAHLDYQLFDCIYPLIEANWIRHTSSVDVALPTQRGLVDFGTFSNTGDLVTLAAGVNFVLVRDHVEFGGAYTHAVSTPRDLGINGFIFKMVFRY